MMAAANVAFVRLINPNVTCQSVSCFHGCSFELELDDANKRFLSYAFHDTNSKHSALKFGSWPRFCVLISVCGYDTKETG